MTSLTFYGGIHEIGGNKILLEDKGTRVFIDFGMQMGKANQYFSEFVNPRKLNGFGDLFEFDLLPDIRGIYRRDYSRHMGYGDESEEDYVHGVLLSHAHVDHCAYIHYLRPEIPIYCSEASKLIMQCFEDTGGAEEYITYKENFKFYTTKKGTIGRAKRPEDREEKERNIQVINPGKTLEIDSISVEPVEIDHSLPGVYGFLIHTSEGDIGYTADIRFHGRRKKESERFVEKCGSDNMDYLLCEGTRIDVPKSETEFDVEDKVKQVISETEKLVVATWPTRDLDRLASFYKAISETDRELVVDTKQAYLLKLFDESPNLHGSYPTPTDPRIKVFVPRKSWGLLGRQDEVDENQILQDYRTWEREFLDYPNFIDYRGVSERQKEYVFYCSDFALPTLIDVRPEEGSGYVRSSTEPFDDEMKLDQDKVKRWLAQFNLLTRDGSWHKAHVSGHGTADQLEHVIDGAGAKTLVPIHTTYEEKFDSLHKNVRNAQIGIPMSISP